MSKAWVRCSSVLRVVVTVIFIATFGSEPLLRAGAGGVVDAAGALVVSTDPVGANVYLDGRYAGQTPLQVSVVAAGRHRVRVVKSGYLENSRLIDIAPGRPADVRVKLTRGATAAAGEQIGVPKGPESKKWLWIGAAAGGGIAAVALLSKSSNKAPVPGTFSVSTRTGLAAATPVTFAAEGASDPDDDGLTYKWEFGDGTIGSGQTVSHTYTPSGTFMPTLTVSDGKDSASTTNGSITMAGLTGTWRGQNAPYTLTIVQTNATVSITYDDVSGSPSVARRWTGTGTVAAPRDFTVILQPVTNANGQLTASASIDATGNVITGSFIGFVTSPFPLDARRQ